MYYDGHKVRFVNGYPAIYIDEENYTVYLHILEMEKHLGRKLYDEEVVHHCDKNRENYSIDNLWCFRTLADHTAFHNGCDALMGDDGIYYCPNKYNYCSVCGKQIDRNATLCSECYNKKRSDCSKRPNKDELCDIIKLYNGNFTKIGEFFGVSDNAVRKWCRKYDIPSHSFDYKYKARLA